MSVKLKPYKMKKIYTLIIFLFAIIANTTLNAQVFSWNTYTAGATTYSKTANSTTMDVTLTGTGFSSGYPLYSVNGGGFLALGVDWSNRTSAVTSTITFTKPLAGVSFNVFDVDQTSSWDDLVTISAVTVLNTTVYPSITVPAYSRKLGSNNNQIEGNADNATFTNAPATADFGSTFIKSITITYSAGAQSPSNPAFQVIGIGQINFWEVLPVKLVSFTGANKNGNGELKWSVENQENFSHFEVERSIAADGVFIKIADVKATAGAAASYSVTDPSVKVRNAWYRLKMVDMNGQYVYSSIIMLTFEKNIVSVLPTLVSAGQSITINIATSGRVKSDVALYDMSGRMVKQLRQVNGSIKMETGGLQSGTYIIHVTDGASKETFKITIQ
jgi:hypothetical protein